jgi:hypothetical protein
VGVKAWYSAWILISSVCFILGISSCTSRVSDDDRVPERVDRCRATSLDRSGSGR